MITLCLLTLCLLCAGPVFAQRQESYSNPPIPAPTMSLDTRAEDPPVDSGISRTPLPAKGGTIDLQVFLPEVVGKQAFAYVLEFQNSGLLFSDYFQIKTAKTWVQIAVLNPANNQIQQIRREVQLDTPQNSRASGRSILFVTPPTIPAGGLIAELSLEALQNIPRNLSLRLNVVVTVFSTTAPVRFWKYQSVQTVRWS